MHILHNLDFDLVSSGSGMPLNRTVLHHASRPQEVIAQAENLFRDPRTLQTVERGRLQLLLLQRYSLLGGKVRYGCEFESFECLDDGGVQAVFTDGEAVAGEYLVGADGVYSRVRKALYQSLPVPAEEPSRCPLSTVFPLRILAPVISRAIAFFINRPRWEVSPTHWTALYGVTTPLPAELLTCCGEDNGMGTMHWFLRDTPGAYTTYSLQGGRVFWICYQRDPPSSGRRGRYTDAEATATMNSYGDCLYSPCTTSPDGAPPVAFREITSRSERIMKVRLNHTFFRQIANPAGNVVVIGDAAHPMNTFHGQGAAMGIEEALVLCNALLRTSWVEEKEEVEVPGDKAGVRYFEQARLERSERVTNLGWWFGMAVMGDWWIARKVRDFVLERVLGKKPKKVKVAKPEEEGGRKGGTGREKKKKREHWLFDHKINVETKEEFWESLKS